MIKLTLPYPPTVNHYWGVCKNRRYIKPKDVQFRHDVNAVVLENKANLRLTGRIRVEVNAYMPDKRKRDLDNINKALFDALVHADVMVDDDQIDVLISARKEIIKNGKIELVIVEMSKNNGAEE